MTNDAFENIDPDDIADVLVQIETSFNINFVDDELKYISSFAELFEHIIKKIQLDTRNDCTSQQAFYKLRNSMSSVLDIDRQAISPSSSLAVLLPKQSRRAQINQLEQELGFKLGILRPPISVTLSLAILFLAALVMFFFSWKIALSGIIFSIFGFWISGKIGRVLDLQTVEELADKMTKEHYLKSRRDPSTCNKREIEKLLVDWFADELSLEKDKLMEDAKFA